MCFSCFYEAIPERDDPPPPIALVTRPVSYDAYLLSMEQRRVERQLYRKQQTQPREKKRNQKENHPLE